MLSESITMGRIKNLILLCVLFAGMTKNVVGQDGHYWSEDFGNKSMLLSGTANASVDDLGAVFYNPGRLGQIENVNAGPLAENVPLHLGVPEVSSVSEVNASFEKLTHREFR